jgi:N-dimethylarginine dimethylaminohydrolase
MSMMVTSHPLHAEGCFSETGRLSRVLMCRPTYFEIVEPINYTQELYADHLFPKPSPEVMVDQHQGLIATLESEGVQVDLLPAVPDLPYQHATRDVGVVIGDTVVLSTLKEETRQHETAVVESALQRYSGVHIERCRGTVEGGDVFIDERYHRLWVGLGARTNCQGFQFLSERFGQDYEVVPLRFDAHYTHLDTIFAILGLGHAIIYEPAFERDSLDAIRDVYQSIISLNRDEQENAGANVLCVAPDRVITIEKNETVNSRLRDLGYTPIPIVFSEVTKSGGSVRCDTLPIDRASTRVR